MTNTLLGFTMGLTLIGVSGCRHFGGTQQASVDFHQVAPVQDVSAVVVETRNGAIKVRCRPGEAEAGISGTKFGQGVTMAEAQANVERIEIRVERPTDRPGVLRIAAVFPRDVHGGVTFDLVLPDSVALDLSTSNGSVTVTAAGRDVRAETSNGAITATGIAGKVEAKTSNGSVTLEDVAEDVDAVSSNGRLLLKRVGRGRVIARTSNGSIEAHATRGNVQLTSSNGRIVWKPELLPDRPDVRISTDNASVQVEVPTDVRAAVRLNTSNASVRADFSGVQVGDLRSNRDSVSAVLNGGGGLIDVRTSNGQIRFGLIAPQPASRPVAARELEISPPQPGLEAEPQ